MLAAWLFLMGYSWGPPTMLPCPPKSSAFTSFIPSEFCSKITLVREVFLTTLFLLLLKYN